MLVDMKISSTHRATLRPRGEIVMRHAATSGEASLKTLTNNVGESTLFLSPSVIRGFYSRGDLYVY